MIYFNRCKEWKKWVRVESVDKAPLDKLSNGSYRICQDLFEDWCFVNPSLKNQLVWNAVPRKFEYGQQSQPSLCPMRPPPKQRSVPPPPKRRKKQAMGMYNGHIMLQYT